MSAFKWTCVILDDHSLENSTLAEMRDQLLSIGLECHLAGQGGTGVGLFGAIAASAGAIASCDLLFLDMKWGDKTRDVLKGALGNPLLEPREITLQEFQDWCGRFETGLTEKPTQLNPLLVVASERVGYFLAAAASHLNPRAQIALFSESPTVQDDLVTFAMACFLPAPYFVIKKSPEYPLDMSELFARLELPQRRAIRDNPAVRRWLIGQVIVPLLIDLPPVAAEVDLSRDGVTRSVTLNAPLYFPRELGPTVQSTKEQRVDSLLALLPIEPYLMSRFQIASLESVKHAINKMAERGAMTEHDERELRRRCGDCGYVGIRIWMQLQEAASNRGRRDFAGAIRAADWALHNGLNELHEYCLDHDGDFDCDPLDTRIKPPAHDRDSQKHVSRLPFDLVEFERVIDALVDNLWRVKSLETILRHVVSSNEESDTLTLTYLDNSIGFRTISDFRDAVSRSLTETESKSNPLERGLPLALSFIFYYPFKRLEVAMNDGVWHVLYNSATDSVSAAAIHSGWSFGIRWSFEMVSA